MALSGQRLYDGTIEKSLTTHFDLLNLVPDNSQKPIKSFYNQKQFDDGAENAGSQDENPTKWRRVGLVSGRNVHLDTIVWPGGDIVVSGNERKSQLLFEYYIDCRSGCRSFGTSAVSVPCGNSAGTTICDGIRT